VSVRGIKAGKDFPAEMRGEDRSFLLDQKGCRYHPHVGFLRVGTQLVVKNSDGADHNIHGYLGSFAATKFNFSSSPQSTIPDAQSAFLEDAGEYLVKCDIHPWMSAVLHVVTDPYHDVTAAEDAPGKKAGEFVIDGVPPGEYEVDAWHEGMVESPQMNDGKIASYSYSPDVRGKASPQAKVAVAAGQTATVDFTFEAPAKK
jgi:plastocyanin